ncbi:universal stress protein [Natronococcus jeotgali]|uniref:UspA domain-containing protein n=1 Tax=Natronococcus jeotgali DSM 18795 TaxID=1227498 RepID=L9XH71_9EURY|nr:universal stress protein [Natronococcus jeotgali]ELY60003.1 UspA domain-containing protein [Natronococcus jeotgali DSM 18795]
MNQPILVPTDGSEPATAALDHALDVAAGTDSTVHVLHVADADDSDSARRDERSDGAAGGPGAELLERARAMAAERGVTVADHVRRGNPKPVILEYVADNDIGTVIMGAHGRHGIGEYLFGTTTEAVVASSEVPVLTVRADNGKRSYPYERIVVPTDDSDYARAAAELAATIAARNDATLHLLYVADEFPETIDPRSAELPAEVEETALELLADVASELDHDDVVPVVESGSVPHVICSHAEANDADLIVMGTHGWSGFDRLLLGSFTERVIRTAPVPVLTTTVEEE